MNEQVSVTVYRGKERRARKGREGSMELRNLHHMKVATGEGDSEKKVRVIGKVGKKPRVLIFTYLFI